MSVDPAHDRLQFLLAGQTTPTWNGIDYVEIASADQTQLRVHFLTTAPVKGTLAATLPVTICGGEVIGSVAVLPIDETTDWSADEDGRPVLSLSVAAPGDFSIYTLTIDSNALDPYFDAVPFSFKANCPSDLDCAAPDPSCAPLDDEPVPINYLAKDFASFTQALSDFSALRYPFWVERSEADVGVMVMEALSAVADELSYLQDRVSGGGDARHGDATRLAPSVTPGSSTTSRPRRSPRRRRSSSTSPAASRRSRPGFNAARSAPTASASRSRSAVSWPTRRRAR